MEPARKLNPDADTSTEVVKAIAENHRRIGELRTASVLVALVRERDNLKKASEKKPE